MINKYFISIFLDTRRENKKGKFPVKLRVFINKPRQQKLYPTLFEFTEEEFQNIWNTSKPRGAYKESKIRLQAFETRANEIASKLPQFTIEAFERLFIGGNTSGNKDVVFYYDQAIEQMKKNNQNGTTVNYQSSLKSLLKYHKKDVLEFYSITPQWLRDYEKFMIENNHKS